MEISLLQFFFHLHFPQNYICTQPGVQRALEVSLIWQSENLDVTFCISIFLLFSLILGYAEYINRHIFLFNEPPIE